MGGKDDSDRTSYRKGPSDFEKKATGAGPDFQPEFVSNQFITSILWSMLNVCANYHINPTLSYV